MLQESRQMVLSRRNLAGFVMTNDELLSRQPPAARDHACSALLPSSCSALTIPINSAFEARRKRRIVSITEKRVKHLDSNLEIYHFLPKLRLLLSSVANSIDQLKSVITQTCHFEFSLLRHPEALLSHIRPTTIVHRLNQVYHFYLGCSIVCDHLSDEDFHKSLHTHVSELLRRQWTMI